MYYLLLRTWSLFLQFRLYILNGNMYVIIQVQTRFSHHTVLVINCVCTRFRLPVLTVPRGTGTVTVLSSTGMATV